MYINRAQPGAAHREFCSLPFDIVCTTNFDFLLEKQYDVDTKDGRTVHPLIDEEQLSINVGATGTLLLKLHGDLRHPKRLIVTESDYDGFLTNYPLVATFLANLLITKTAVLVGYSLDDPDFRQIWHVVSQRLGKMRRIAYAVLVDAKPGDIARFERRGVKIVNLPGSRERYGDVLATSFAELREYRRENAAATLKPTEEKPLEQFMLPRDAMSRLCLFATPLDVLPFYRENVFPRAEAAGFVPVSATDIVDLGDSVSAKIDTLIDRAAIVVVDATSRHTQIELSLASSRALETLGLPMRRRLHVIPIITEYTQLLGEGRLVQAIKREVFLSEDSPFILELDGVFKRLADEMGLDQNLEPRRLFAAKEYRAAVISAMTLLEATLRERMDKPSRDAVQRPMSMRQLVKRAFEAGVLNVSDQVIYNWIELRNEAVHGGKQIGRQRASEVVNGVEHIIGR